MIAKLITHGPTRNDATAAQMDALDAFTIEGVRHNISFLSTLMQNERWKAGQLSTAFLAEAFPNGFHAPVPQVETEYALAAVAACIDHVAGERKRSISGQRLSSGDCERAGWSSSQSESGWILPVVMQAGCAELKAARTGCVRLK
jgi:propionyl-CoA carboxylase alpha chain